MGINASTLVPAFGQTAGDNAAKPKANFWLNVGYLAPNILPDEEERRFISLPAGIPLDTTKAVEIRGSNEVFRAMCSAQNDLLAHVISEAKKLEPGQSVYIGDTETPGALIMQLRRVSAEAEAIPASSNMFAAAPLKLVA